MTITIYRDYPEDGWESMRVYENGLITGLTRCLPSTDQIREHLTLPRVSAAFLHDRRWSRYAFRYLINPVGSVLAQSDVNHITDQSNAHLLRFLNPRHTVITCHDLIVPVWEDSHLQPNRDRGSLRSQIKSAIKYWRIASLSKAARIIAVSNFTKQQLISKLNIDPATITVIHEGVGERFFSVSPEDMVRVKKRYRLPPNYLLHVGTAAAYKNLPYILEVFAGIVREIPDLSLVKVGHPWPPELLALQNRLGIAKKTRHIPSVPAPDLPPMYTAAKALIHPSHIEGFGRTVLEAMAGGIPVFVSDIPVLHEVAGDAGFYIPLEDAADAAKTITKTLRDRSFQQRHIEKGRQRARKFTWTSAAEQTLRVYQSITTV